MKDAWIETIPELGDFGEVADPTQFVPLPDDWHIGVSDVVDSAGAIRDGRYKAVNLAGAATISALSNALDGDLSLFVFGGDGARFAVRADQASAAADALARVAAGVERDVGLRLRVGLEPVTDARTNGTDVRVAFWQASDHVRYAMFTGGGLEWLEARLKKGEVSINHVADGVGEPDLTGLSCQWGPIRSQRGQIVSLIVKPAAAPGDARFRTLTTAVVAILERAGSLNPVPDAGPNVRWPSAAIALQSQVAHNNLPPWRRRVRVVVSAALMWLLFKAGRRVGRFDPNSYRREIAENTDFRKFDDALMMTVDCSDETIAALRHLLDAASADGTVRYGLHTQDQALMTCVVPSAFSADHMHFVDGAGGGYASAARQLRDN
ncbi:MAG: DUF3095 family protein [Pseudomonadota bacterium]